MKNEEYKKLSIAGCRMWSGSNDILIIRKISRQALYRAGSDSNVAR